MRVLLITTTIALTSLGSLSWAASPIQIRQVKFKKGESAATIGGSLSGEQIIDYKLRARAGQTMRVKLKTTNGANYFNVLPPGSEAAIAIGANMGNDWTGTLPADGEYKVRVYLMRSAARSNEKATYTLSVGITGSADAKVAGTNYHATGMVPCSVGADPKGSARCSFGVIRSGSGKAEVHLAPPGYDVKLHKDKLRVLKFTGDKVTSLDPKAKVTSQKRGDNWSISVNDFDFYIIPQAVISGG